MKFILTILLLISLSANSQLILNASRNYVPLAHYLLNDYPGATYAYSFRRLSGSYAGYCIQVLDVTTHITYNIGFANNYLDTATLKADVVNHVACLSIFYDQSGNGYNMSNSVLTNTPIIFDGTKFTYINGRISATFNPGAATSMNTTYVQLNVYSIFAVAELSGSAGATNTIFNTGDSLGASNTRDVIFYESTTQLGVQRSNNTLYPSATQSATGTNNNVLVGIFTGSSLTAYVNTSAGTPVSTATTGNATGAKAYMGVTNQTGGLNYYYYGWISELVVWKADQTANVTGISANINNAYLPKMY